MGSNTHYSWCRRMSEAMLDYHSGENLGLREIPQAPDLSAPPRLAWWMLALVALLSFAVYANSLKNGFAFDDCAIVEKNPHVVNLEWTGIWYDNYWPRSDGIQPDVLYRPITLWSYLAN